MKTILITFFDVKGMINKEFIPQGTTINFEFYKTGKNSRENQSHVT